VMIRKILVGLAQSPPWWRLAMCSRVGDEGDKVSGGHAATIPTALDTVNEWHGGMQGIAVAYEVSAPLTSTG
jgi:hypothetical protein